MVNGPLNTFVQQAGIAAVEHEQALLTGLVAEYQQRRDLAWLAGYGAWERDEWAFDRDHDDEFEPPVPPGLRELSAAQQALAEFLRLDPDLLQVAAAASAPLQPTVADPAALRSWIAGLPAAEKNQLLVRVAGDDAAAVHMELARRFRDTTAGDYLEASTRTVADLLDGVARCRAERERREADARAAEHARRAAEQARRREQRVDELAKDEDGAWERVESLIATVKQREYDEAVAVLIDLGVLAERSGQQDEFARRITMLRTRHARKQAFLARLNRSVLGSSAAAVNGDAPVL